MRSIKVGMHVCVRYYGESAVFASFVCCYESMPVARCYSGSRDQGKIDQKREYISINGKTAFSSFQTMWGRWRIAGVQVHCSAERSTSSR